MDYLVLFDGERAWIEENRGQNCGKALGASNHATFTKAKKFLIDCLQRQVHQWRKQVRDAQCLKKAEVS